MSEPKTPNLGLNKIDRSSPSTTYFDLDKYLDQNWEKIDDFSEQMEEKTGETAAQVSSIQERLDTEQRKSVTLEPGLQIINAERASAFKLEGLKGRTLVNLLGRDGGCEAVSDWFTTTDVAAALDSSDKTQGTNSIKITPQTGNTGGSLYKLLGKGLSNSKNYLAIADLKKGTSTSVSLSLWNGTVNVSGTVVTASEFTPSVLLIPGSAVGGSTNNLQVSVAGTTAGQYSHVDAVRLYEVSAAELTSLSSMTAEQVAAKYPYVDSVQPVRNPYAIRYGENLLPPFYEWTPIGILEGSIRSPYTTNYKVTNSQNAYYYVDIPLQAQTTYTFSADHNGYLSVGNLDSNTTVLDNTSAQTATFTTSKAILGRVYISNIQGTAKNGTYIFKKPMLNIGNTAKTFKPREDAMLALQTDLYADPVTGANADEVFERNGQYFKLAKWRKVVLDGSQAWVYGDAAHTGLKQVKVVGLVSGGVAASGLVTKYDGKIIPQGTTGSVSDTNAVTGSGDFYISIPNTDSGWGDSYTPTVDEIKAYFMGWTMFNGSAGTGVGNSPDVPTNNVYNGTGTKWWARRSDGVARTWADATNTLPTTQAPNWTPYHLVYQLATPTVEPVTSEGQLTFIEGDNQIEVGTGIVLLEGTKPVRYEDWAVVNYTYGGNHALLRNKVNVFMSVYKDNKKMSNYLITRAPSTSYGNEYLGIRWVDFDQSASYSVTYLMLDKSPVASFVGSIADNEKALLTDLVQDVQQATARLSVVESKKAEKDAPGWITPTLLNGWTNYSANDYPIIGFRKDSAGNVSIRGMIKGGAVANGISLFTLPVGYRPIKHILFPVSCSDGLTPNTALVSIAPNGTVSFNRVSQNNYVTLFLPPFPAEQ